MIFVGTRRFLMILRKVTIVLRNKKIPDNHCLSGYPASKNVVEATGLEPTASASRTQRSTKLSHASIQR